MPSPSTLLNSIQLSNFLTPDGTSYLADSVPIDRSLAIRGIRSIALGVPPCVMVMHRRNTRSRDRLIHGLEMLAALKWAFSADGGLLISPTTGAIGTDLSPPAMPVAAALSTVLFARWSRLVSDAGLGDDVLEAGDRICTQVREMAMPVFVVRDDAEDPASSEALQLLLANFRQS